jgi:hypothetical protein
VLNEIRYLHIFSLPADTEGKRAINSKACFGCIGKQKVFLKAQAGVFNIIWSIEAI